MRLVQYLNELNFVPGKDQDYIANSTGVIVFNKNDQYKLEGKTHNLTSHALKHLKEFDHQYFSKQVLSAQDYILSTPEFYVLTKSGKYHRNPDKLGFAIVVNTLDRVNDKILNNKKLTPEEKQLEVVLQNITHKYEAIINNVLSKSVNIDNYNTEQIQQLDPDTTLIFTIYDPYENQYFVNFSKLWFGVKSDKGIKTFYSIKSFNKLMDKLLRRDFKNKNIKRLLRGM